MEFFEFYEMYKTMKTQKVESARTTAVATSKTNVTEFFDSNNFVQRGNDVVNVGEPKNIDDVPTKFEVYEQEVNGKKYYCIRSGIFTKKRVRDAQTGKEKMLYFNISAKNLANNMIKAVDGILTLEIPIAGKKRGWNAWGFKTKKKALEVVAALPKVVKGADIDKANKEYHEKKRGTPTE